MMTWLSHSHTSVDDVELLKTLLSCAIAKLHKMGFSRRSDRCATAILHQLPVSTFQPVRDFIISAHTRG